MTNGWTLQGLIDGEMEVAAYCQRSACNHHSTLDLQKLRAKLGPDAPAMRDDLVPKLYCAKCGGKQIGLIYSPAGNRKYLPYQTPWKPGRPG